MADMCETPPEACETLKWLAGQPWPGGGAAEQQPPPKPGREVVADHVLADIHARVEAGEAKYGTKLMTYNGRDPLWDLYQELLDAVFYCRQAILEREAARG